MKALIFSSINEEGTLEEDRELSNKLNFNENFLKLSGSINHKNKLVDKDELQSILNSLF